MMELEYLPGLEASFAFPRSIERDPTELQNLVSLVFELPRCSESMDSQKQHPDCIARMNYFCVFRYSNRGDWRTSRLVWGDLCLSNAFVLFVSIHSLLPDPDFVDRSLLENWV